MILIGIGKTEERERIFKKVLKVYRELEKMPPTLSTLTHNEEGKPIIKGCENIKISLSHSGEMLVIALSNEEIGIDIQENRPTDYEKICARYGISANSLTDFYKAFTLAEAHAKLVGNGLAPALHSAHKLEGKTYRFIKGYTLSVAGEGEVVFVSI